VLHVWRAALLPKEWRGLFTLGTLMTRGFSLHFQLSLPHTMYRCVVLHRNGTSELQEVQPALHQKLRHLEYKRFVVEFVRDSDGISSTAPLYCQFSPSSWQAQSAAKQLWGRHSGAVRLFDEDGHLVQDAMATAGTPFQGSATIASSQASSAQASSASGPGSSARHDDESAQVAVGRPNDGDVRFTREDVELLNSLARFVQEPGVPDSAFGSVPRQVVMEKVRDLALRIASLTPRA
jgi:hypothetical protein